MKTTLKSLSDFEQSLAKTSKLVAQMEETKKSCKSSCKKKVAKADGGDGQGNGQDAADSCDCCCCCDQVDALYGTLQSIYSSLLDQIGWLSDRLWQHQEGHLPPINSAEQMTKALKALGLNAEYDVAKKTIYASTGVGGQKLFEISVVAPEKKG